MEKYEWIDEQMVRSGPAEGHSEAESSVSVVPGALRYMPSITRTGQHKDALFHQCHPLRLCPWSPLILRLEVQLRSTLNSSRALS